MEGRNEGSRGYEGNDEINTNGTNPLINALEALKATNLKVSGQGIEQMQRNETKRLVGEALGKVCEGALGNFDEVAVWEIEQGTVLEMKHPTVGKVSILVETTIKNVDFDAEAKAKEWTAKKEAKEAKREAKEAKARKREEEWADTREGKRSSTLTREERIEKMMALREERRARREQHGD